MKSIAYFFNIIHYCIYKVDSKRHLFSNKLNPFVLIGKIPAVKKKFEEQGTTHLDVVNKIWTDKRYGFSIMISGGGIVAILTFLIWGITSTMASLFDIYFYVNLAHLISYGTASFLICYFAVFKEDKYLKYFKQFEKWTKKDKWKYGLLSFTFIVSSVILWIYSFRFLP